MFNFIKIIVIGIDMPFYQMVNSSRAGTYSEFIVGTIYKWKGKKKRNGKERRLKEEKKDGGKWREKGNVGKTKRWHCQVCPEVTAHVVRITSSQIK